MKLPTLEEQERLRQAGSLTFQMPYSTALALLIMIQNGLGTSGSMYDLAEEARVFALWLEQAITAEFPAYSEVIQAGWDREHEH